jgi:hypothetical protein
MRPKALPLLQYVINYGTCHILTYLLIIAFIPPSVHKHFFPLFPLSLLSFFFFLHFLYLFSLPQHFFLRWHWLLFFLSEGGKGVFSNIHNLHIEILNNGNLYEKYDFSGFNTLQWVYNAAERPANKRHGIKYLQLFRLQDGGPTNFSGQGNVGTFCPAVFTSSFCRCLPWRNLHCSKSNK